MIRVRDFDLDGITLKLASLSVSEAEEYVKQSTEMISRKDEIAPAEWFDRAVNLVAMSLAKSDVTWTPERVRAELDMPTVNAAHLKVLEFSGLRTGEAKAVSVLPKSEAA